MNSIGLIVLCLAAVGVLVGQVAAGYRHLPAPADLPHGAAPSLRYVSAGQLTLAVLGVIPYLPSTALLALLAPGAPAAAMVRQASAVIVALAGAAWGLGAGLSRCWGTRYSAQVLAVVEAGDTKPLLAALPPVWTARTTGRTRLGPPLIRALLTDAALCAALAVAVWFLAEALGGDGATPLWGLAATFALVIGSRTRWWQRRQRYEGLLAMGVEPERARTAVASRMPRRYRVPLWPIFLHVEVGPFVPQNASKAAEPLREARTWSLLGALGAVVVGEHLLRRGSAGSLLSTLLALPQLFLAVPPYLVRLLHPYDLASFWAHVPAELEAP